MNQGLTVQQAAKELNVSASTVRDMCKRGELQWYPAGKGTKRITRRILAQSVRDYIEREANAIIPLPSDGLLNADGFSELRAAGWKGV